MTSISKMPTGAHGCDRVAESHLISVNAAVNKIEANVGLVSGTEEVSLEHAKGRVLVEPIAAREAVPPFNNSAMDGFALNSSVLKGNGPWVLPVSGRVPAGRLSIAALPKDTAVQVFTGAPVPPGADVVVKQEDVTRIADEIEIVRCPPPASHIRHIGEDMAKGQIMIKSGRRLTPRDVAVCAAAGQDSVRVRRRIKVALLVTGDEVRQTGAVRENSQIWDINTPLLKSTIQNPDVEFVEVLQIADSKAATISELVRLSQLADLIVTTGGISVGEEDHVLPAMHELGAQLIFSGVALKPGKPVSLGKLGNAVWIGLPGNPLSALITWTIFGKSVLDRLCGSNSVKHNTRQVKLKKELRHNPGRTEMRLALLSNCERTGVEQVSFPSTTHSGRVSLLSIADGFIWVPSETDVLPAGSQVEFCAFEGGSDQ